MGAVRRLHEALLQSSSYGASPTPEDFRRELMRQVERPEPVTRVEVNDFYASHNADARKEYYEAVRANTIVDLLEKVDWARKDAPVELSGYGMGDWFQAQVDTTGVLRDEHRDLLNNMEDSLVIVGAGGGLSCAEGTLFWISACELSEEAAVAAAEAASSPKNRPPPPPCKARILLRGSSANGVQLERMGHLVLHVLFPAGGIAQRYQAAFQLQQGRARHPLLESALLDVRSPVPGTYGDDITDAAASLAGSAAGGEAAGRGRGPATTDPPAAATAAASDAGLLASAADAVAGQESPFGVALAEARDDGAAAPDLAEEVGGRGGACSSKTSRRLRPDIMEVSEQSRRVVQKLQNRVEVIHPRAGKASSIIFHTLCAHLPAGAFAVVVCKSNRAASALMEGWNAKAHKELPALALPSAGALSSTAAKFTLQRQADHDQAVLRLADTVQILEDHIEALGELLAARARRLLGGGPATEPPQKQKEHSRLDEEGLMAIPGLKRRTLIRLLEMHDPSFCPPLPHTPVELGPSERSLEQRWAHVLQLKRQALSSISLTEEMWTTHMQVVNRGRRILADHMAHILPINLAGKSSTPTASAASAPKKKFLWDMGKHRDYEAARLEQARVWLRLAKDEARPRAIRRTRVFVGTVASVCKLQKLRESYSADFPSRCFLAICDEASALSETFVPELVSLHCENVLLLGQPPSEAAKIPSGDGRRLLLERAFGAGYGAQVLSWGDPGAKAEDL